MAIPETLQRFLADAGASYTIVQHAPSERIQQAAAQANLERHKVARAVLVTADDGLRLIVVPTDHMLDFGRIEAYLGRAVELAPDDAVQGCFPDCEPCTTPVLGMAYQIPVLVDQSFTDIDPVHIATGRHDCLLTLGAETFQRLMVDATWGEFSRPVAGVSCADWHQNVELKPNPYLPEEVDAQSLFRLYTLPPLPQTALRILQLRDDPDATVDQLCALVETDPALAAQVVRFARSAFFGYRGRIDTIHDAVLRVLGFDLVVNMSLGMSAVQTFQVPATGPLGLKAFWRHAAYSAALSQQLARQLPARQGVKPGLAYLSALLHNVGFLLMGHLFRPEFVMLNRLASANPEVPVTHLEGQVLPMGEAGRVLAVGHPRLGAWLMHAWNMPEEVVTSIAQHHNPDYDGPHASYAALVLLADRLTRRLGLGDGDCRDLPEPTLARLGLSAVDVERVCEHVLGGREGLEAMAGAAA